MSLKEAISEVLELHFLHSVGVVDEHAETYEWSAVCNCSDVTSAVHGYLEAEKLFADHQAERVYEALTKAGSVEWGYRAPGYNVTASAYEELARDMAEHVGGPVASRVVGPWVEES